MAGDLEKADVQNPWEFEIGTHYVAALKPGSYYAMFFRRDCPHHFEWAFADDLIELGPSDKGAVQRLVAVADRIYAGTSIRQFRRTILWAYVKPPDLPEGLASLCKQFRDGGGRRTEFGRRIAESDLGSRIDNSRPFSSIRTYLPPKIPLSRQQVLALFGEPTWRSGWTYDWRCDDFSSSREGGTQVGILSVTFDKSESAVRVLFDMQDRSRWIRPSRPADMLAQLDGDPAGVAHRFQEALKRSDWKQALSCCSAPVRAKAQEFDLAERFFTRFVPVKEIIPRPFNPHLFSSRDGRVTRVSDGVGLAVEDDWQPEWPWSLVRANAQWLVDFDLLPLSELSHFS